MKSKYTAAQIAEVQQLHKDGYRYDDITELTGIPHGTLPKLIYPERYKTSKAKYKNYTTEQREKVKELYKKGYSYAHITQLTGVKRGTITNIMNGETDRINQPPRKIEYRNRPTQMEMDLVNAEPTPPPPQTDLQKYKITEIVTERIGLNCIITPNDLTLQNGLDPITIKHEDFHEILQLLIDADQIITQMKGK